MLRAMPRLALLLLLAACAAKSPPPAPPVAAPAVDPNAVPAWLVGAWEGANGARETWIAAGQAVLAVGFPGKGFEVMIIDRQGGKLRFSAWPSGAGGVRFAATEVTASSIRFENQAHDFPKVIGYRRDGDTLHAFIAGADGLADKQEFRWKRSAGQAASELERADLDFAADTAARGADGWTAWFAPDGALWREEPGRIEGHEAVHAAISKTFNAGKFMLAWKPVGSGLDGSGGLGFTVGTWTGQARGEDGTTSAAGTGAYVTVWSRQPDGAWRILFDTGVSD
jgi:ketosteroid isomerase-like protein